MFVLCGGRHADAVGVGTLCTRWCGGRGVLREAGGCCVVGERGYTTYTQNHPSRLHPAGVGPQSTHIDAHWKHIERWTFVSPSPITRPPLFHGA